jgi:hypothetical protein
LDAPATLPCLRATSALSKLQLDKLSLLIGLSDKTIYLDRLDNIVVGQDQQEKELGEIENFSEPLGLEIVDRSSGREVVTPVPLISDVRDKDSVGHLCAFLYRKPTDATLLILRFNVPLVATLTFRLWFEPGTFARPGMEDQPPIPRQAISVLIAETAFACLPHLSKVYSQNVYIAFRDSVSTQKLEFRQIFDKWRMTDTGTGVQLSHPPDDYYQNSTRLYQTQSMLQQNLNSSLAQIRLPQ